jgi:hypothetical protein
MHTGLLVRTNGTHERVTWEAGTEYATIKAALGGVLLEVVTFTLPDGQAFMAYIDEEGKFANPCIENILGTALWQLCYGNTDWIAGDMLLIGADTNEEGDTLGLSERDLRRFEEILAGHPTQLLQEAVPG